MDRFAVYNQCLWEDAEGASMSEYANRQMENIQHDSE